jgi:hypothetical protein
MTSDINNKGKVLANIKETVLLELIHEDIENIFEHGLLIKENAVVVQGEEVLSYK